MSTMSSPLSDPGSDNSGEDDYYAKTMQTDLPPPKRQRINSTSIHEIPALTHRHQDTHEGEISSDSEGSVPASPTGTTRMDELDDHIYPQVTTCEWDGCPAGDMGNMDRLVEHINAAHVEGRTKTYICEWNSCARKNMPHASGYALRAHMRSHTREKPFYCLLPECDKCFTRSDALAKHMRIVHETEALRPSDPVPRTMQPLLNKSQARLKLTVKQSGHNVTAQSSPGQSPLTSLDSTQLPPTNAEGFTDLPADQFTPEELTLGPKELYRLLRRQVHWLEEEAEELGRECEIMESIRRKEWEDKEILLDQVIKNELDWHDRRQLALASLPPAPMALDTRQKAEEPGFREGEIDTETGDVTEAKDEMGGDEAAAVLASLSAVPA